MFLVCFFLDILVTVVRPFAALAGVTEEQFNEGLASVRSELGCGA